MFINIIKTFLLLLFWANFYLLCQLRIKKGLIFLSFIYSLLLFLSLWRSMFLTYIVFLLPKKLFSLFLERQICCQKIPWFLFEKVFVCPPLLKKKIAGYRIQGWWFFPLNTLYISFHSLPACMVSKGKLVVNLFFFKLIYPCCKCGAWCGTGTHKPGDHHHRQELDA